MPQDFGANILPQKRRARQIDGAQLNAAYERINWLSRIAFNPAQFQVSKAGSNINVSLGLRIPDAVDVRWKLTKYDYQSITVGTGTIRRGMAAITWTSGGADDVTSLTTASTTYYIYAKLASASDYDAGVYPESVTIESSTVWPIVGPPDDSPSRRFILLGWVTTDTTGAFTQDSITQVQFGDYNMPTWITDTDAEKDDGTKAASDYSLQKTATGPWQIYGFDSASDTTPGANDLVMLWHAALPADYVIYTGKSNLLDWLDAWNNATFTAAAAAWLQAGVHTHAQHTSFASDDHVQATGYPYLLLSDIGTAAQSATRNLCAADMRIGDASGAASINPAGRILYDEDGTTTRISWASDAVTIAAAAACTWNFTDALNMNIGAASAWVSSAQFTIRTNTDGDNDFYLGADGYKWNALNFWADAIGWNGVAGVSITNWSTNGGLTGTGISAKILQFPDGQGGTIDYEVLVRTP